MSDKNCILKKTSIKEAIASLDIVEKKILVVINNNREIEGTVTDGDIRRGILRGVALDSCASKVMNSTPVVMKVSDSAPEIVATMEKELLFFIPLVDSNNKYIELLSLESLKAKDNKCAIFILAGGLGSRLKELTRNTPKPMLPINGRPMLESLILSFRNQGYKNFYISVNYLKEQIINFFNDGSDLGVKIKYVIEEKRLGTAGPLSLLNVAHYQETRYIVVNSDVRVNSDFNALFRYHIKSKNIITVCAKEHEHQIPYGVIRFDDDTLISIDEKPVSSYFVSAGLYLIDRKALSLLDHNIATDMPDYINRVKDNNSKVGLYPLHEEWLDVGLPKQYEAVNANKEDFV